MTSSTPGDLAAASDHPAGTAASGASRVVATWLLVCCALVFALIVVGGVTRLTHSGLSITEWQPVLGTLPPLSESQWNEAFAKYQMTPEYLQVNRGMSIDAFKGIFWMEYVHRLLGRLVGFAFIVPLLWFVARGKLPSSPLLNGHVGPPEIVQISPWDLIFVNDMATVQFDHRLLAWRLLVLVQIWWWRVRVTPVVTARARLAAHLLLATLLAQVSRGIS